MASKHDLGDWLVAALRDRGGSARIADICGYVWDHHEEDLRQSGDLFFTWQYDIRWAATNLRQARILRPAASSPKGVWELA